MVTTLTTAFCGRQLGPLPQTPLAAAPANPPITVPATPKRATVVTSDSPPVPSPSDIPRFLKFAETKLGVKAAMVWASPMKRRSYGPDILKAVSDKDLLELGMAHGDVLRLKRGTTKWWGSQEAKRKYADMTGDDNDRNSDRNTASNTRIHYERAYRTPAGEPDGYHSWFGPPLVDEDMTDADRETTYFDEATQRKMPIPEGFTIPMDDNPF